jgi:hypothetical protein
MPQVMECFDELLLPLLLVHQVPKSSMFDIVFLSSLDFLLLVIFVFLLSSLFL